MPREQIKLTAPQRNALTVLADAHPNELRAHKRSTRTTPIPTVNIRAANELCRKGLARTQLPDRRFWSPYTCDYKFQITDAGREIVAAWDSRSM